MHLLEKSLSESETEPLAIPVWFNPWRFQKEDHLIIPWDKGMGIAFMGRLYFYVGDEIEHLFLLIRTIGLYDLYLVALSLMPAVGGIRIGGILQGGRRDLFRRIQD